MLTIDPPERTVPNPFIPPQTPKLIGHDVSENRNKKKAKNKPRQGRAFSPLSHQRPSPKPNFANFSIAR